MEGQEFLKTFEDYCRKINSGKYLEQHALDHRNSDPVQTRIQLDTDSRECIAYLKELILMCNQTRSDSGLEVIP